VATSDRCFSISATTLSLPLFRLTSLRVCADAAPLLFVLVGCLCSMGYHLQVVSPAARHFSRHQRTHVLQCGIAAIPPLLPPPQIFMFLLILHKSLVRMHSRWHGRTELRTPQLSSRFDLRATHAHTFLPAALASVPFGFVLVRVRGRARGRRSSRCIGESSSFNGAVGQVLSILASGSPAC
jgi:hypothetical protein